MRLRKAAGIGNSGRQVSVDKQQKEHVPTNPDRLASCPGDPGSLSVSQFSSFTEVSTLVHTAIMDCPEAMFAPLVFAFLIDLRFDCFILHPVP
jgi:hypothetical protein